MLGNGARFLGPSAAGNAAGSNNNNINNSQQHQAHFGRGVWPSATTFQANGGECEYRDDATWRYFLLNIIAQSLEAIAREKCLFISSMLPKWKNSISLLSFGVLEVGIQTKLIFRCLRNEHNNNSELLNVALFADYFESSRLHFCTFRQNIKKSLHARCNEQQLTTELNVREHITSEML